MKTDNKLLFLFLLFSLQGIALQVEAQQIGDEFKKQLKQSLKSPEIIIRNTPKYSPLEIEQNPTEKLQVSPTTQLPSIYNHLKGEYSDMVQRFKPDFTVTGKDLTSHLARSAIDYSDGKVHAIPDARSITQMTNYTRNDFGLGFYADEDSPEWMKKLRNILTPQYRNIDLDPVRTIQAIKARKRKEAVDKILKAYKMEE